MSPCVHTKDFIELWPSLICSERPLLLQIYPYYIPECNWSSASGIRKTKLILIPAKNVIDLCLKAAKKPVLLAIKNPDKIASYKVQKKGPKFRKNN